MEEIHTEEGYSFLLPPAGKGYIKEVGDKCYWEIIIRGNKVLVIERGGPLESAALVISGDNLEVEDDWNWGAG